MIEHVADEDLSWTPPWLLERARTFGDGGPRSIALMGDAEPELLADLPGERVGKARMRAWGEESTRQMNERLNNWVVVGVPNEGWAKQMFGEPDVEPAVGARRVLCAARTRTTRSRRGGATSRASARARGS